LQESIVIARRKLPLCGKRWNEPTLRELLAGQLAGTLGVHRIEIDPAKSFDEYGLDSINAVIATELIGERLGIELPPEFLLINRSIDAVVRALLDSQRSDGPVGTVQGNGAAIFLVPGAGGRDEPSLARFRDQSAPTLTFEVVRIGEWRDWIEHDLDFDGLIARACRHIQAVGTEGPLQVAGYSQGGQLAYATALALSRAGRSVGFVGLLDSTSDVPSGQASPKTSILSGVLRLASRYIGATVRGLKDLYHSGGVRIRVVFMLWRLCRGPAERRKLLMFIVRFGHPLFRGPGGVKLDLKIQMKLFSEMWGAWSAKNAPAHSLHSPVFLFRSGDPGTPDLGWQSCCSDLTIVPVVGTHHTIFDAEYVSDLITRFGAAVRSVAVLHG
jgi:thioesterase domain-containing protein/acyl carrier protein